jgi:hypothetical protein
MVRRLLVAFVAALFALASCAPLLASQAAAQKQPPAKKAKKVWTNEDLEALRPSGVTGTTVTAPAASPASGEATAADKSAEKKDKEEKDKKEDPVEKLLKRLTPLRTELDATDAQLRSLRNAGSSGSTTGGGVDVSKTAGGVNTTDQIARLEQRRSELLRQIAAIEDEARRMGVAPGAIR